MKPATRWTRVSEILSRALDLPEAQRTGFLSEAIRQEPDLETDVLALLEEVRSTQVFLEQPIPTTDGPEGGFGPYRVIGELGQGGMGVVHLAERSDGQFTRRVAIKRVGSADRRPDVLRRFRDERQIQARLDHPNIARLLDSGLDGEGVPYLVMEHVDGVPLMAYCRERNLTVPQQLALFLKVCAAVQHAHQNLVIHRDLKPGNILVTAEGEPKLLDFGIAKFLGEATGGEATETANRALTLDYASPEQVRGQPVTTASDVYSLGVVLYHLLADVKPYEVGTRSLAEAVELVCVSIPAPPSRVAPEARRREIAGDLDGIVCKAMEKAPADRYASVAELKADLVAHLENLPVKARRPSFGYVARKFVRRHRAGTLVAAAVLVLLAGAMAAVLRQARETERQRVRAEQRFNEVRQLAHYVIYDLQDGIEKLAGSTELRRQMVERSLAYLDSLAGEAAGDAALQAELAGAYSRLGQVLGKSTAANLGDRKGAIASYNKARDLLRQVVARDPRNADVRRQLARVLIDLHTASDQLDLRASVLQEATALWEALAREDAASEENLRGLASAQFMAFGLAQASGRRDEAQPHMERALATFQRLLDAKPEDTNRKRNVALCHKSLAGHLSDRDPVRAVEHAREAARLDAERLAAEPHSAQAKLDYSFDLSALGDCLFERADYGQALPIFQQALALRRELWSADKANVHARARMVWMMTRVGMVHVFTGHPRQAAPLLAEALEHLEALPREDIINRVMLSYAYMYTGEVAGTNGKDPCTWYRQLAAVLPSIPANTAAYYFASKTAEHRDRALERLKSCPE